MALSPHTPAPYFFPSSLRVCGGLLPSASILALSLPREFSPVSGRPLSGRARTPDRLSFREFAFKPNKQLTMLLAVALPAIILAHLLGLVLLLYSLEKVSGVVSRTWKRVRGIPLDIEQRGGTHDGGALAASPMKAAVAGVKSKGWVRGCACTVSSV